VSVKVYAYGGCREPPAAGVVNAFGEDALHAASIHDPPAKLVHDPPAKLVHDLQRSWFTEPRSAICQREMARLTPAEQTAAYGRLD
jgi:hypothetical protein